MSIMRLSVFSDMSTIDGVSAEGEHVIAHKYVNSGTIDHCIDSLIRCGRAQITSDRVHFDGEIPAQFLRSRAQSLIQDVIKGNRSNPRWRVGASPGYRPNGPDSQPAHPAQRDGPGQHGRTRHRRCGRPHGRRMITIAVTPHPPDSEKWH
jgi:hypothetical protein